MSRRTITGILVKREEKRDSRWNWRSPRIIMYVKNKVSRITYIGTCPKAFWDIPLSSRVRFTAHVAQSDSPFIMWFKKPVKPEVINND